MPALDTEPKTLHARVLSGSFVLLTGSALVTSFNFVYNVAVARFLGPTAFGHATAVYTLLILTSAVTLSFQIVAAKVVAQRRSAREQTAAYRAFHKNAWVCGVLIGLLLILARQIISNYLNLPDSNLAVWLAIGVAFYVPLGSRRGYLQGSCNFRRLAANMVLEASCRLFGSLLMIAFGSGVTGVIAANAAGVTIAYGFAIPRLPGSGADNTGIPDALREALQAIVFFVGQVVINNCDIVVVKHFFPPVSAGLYAAIALVGRVVYASSWAVVNSMFPIVAGTTPQERKKYNVLGTTLLLVLGLGTVISLALRLAPAWLWADLFGPQFIVTGKYGLPYLLALYGITTCAYSLSVVMIAYEMSYRIANTGWVQLAFSGILIAGIYRFHSSLQQVILVQLVLMICLLAMVAIPFLRNTLAGFGNPGLTEGRTPLRMIRRLSEDEVIAEFLRIDFHNPEFAEYQEMTNLVQTPDLTDPAENAQRRALFFLRHGTLWRVLPKDTEWFEVAMRPENLERIRVFPRAQWRKLARGNYALPDILRSLHETRHPSVDDDFQAKLADLSDSLSNNLEGGSVLLIGLDGSSPLTILDGNHRLVAASMNHPPSLHRLRFLCGLSPKMAQCCWYKTNVATLCRYAGKVLQDAVHDPEDELARLMQSS